MANNPYIQTNFTASDMLGATKPTKPATKKSAPAPSPKAEPVARPARPARPAPAPKVEEEPAIVEPAVEIVAEEVTKSDEE